MGWRSIYEIAPLVLSIVVTFIENIVFPHVWRLQLSITDSVMLFLLQLLIFTVFKERLGILRRIEGLAEKEKIAFRDRREFPLIDYLQKAKRSIWVTAATFGRLIGSEWLFGAKI